jgi:hypothetical protein
LGFQYYDDAVECRAEGVIMNPEEQKAKDERLRDALVKIFSGLLGIVFIVFMILFWLK